MDWLYSLPAEMNNLIHLQFQTHDAWKNWQKFNSCKEEQLLSSGQSQILSSMKERKRPRGEYFII